MSAEEESGCGFSWDHSLDEGESADGITVYICRECGAEIIEDES
jgi:hypothetical protein